MLKKLKTFEICCDYCGKTALTYKDAEDKYADVRLPAGWISFKKNPYYTFSKQGDYCPNCKDKNQ